MTINRTSPTIYVLSRGNTYAGCATEIVTAICEADEDTTAEIKKIGLSHGMVANPGASSITLTYYGATEPGGTAYALYDEDGVAVTQTVAAGTMAALPTAIAGVPYLLPVTNNATTGTGTDAEDTLYFFFER